MIQCKLFPLILLLSVPFISFAQDEGERQKDKKKEIESMKIGFITSKLDFSPEESQEFWPVYNAFSKELGGLRSKIRTDMKKLRSGAEELSEDEIENIIDRHLDYRQQEIEIRKKYHSEFKKVLSVRKVATLYEVEEDFKRELLKMLRNKRRDREGLQPRPGR